MSKHWAVRGTVAGCALALPFSFGCGDACDEAACEAVARPQRATIDQGVVGIVAYRTDVCVDDCCGCDLGEAKLEVWRTSSRVTGAEEANAIIANDLPSLEIDAQGPYARSLDAGSYLICHFIGSDARCAAVELAAHEVATVNVQTVFGPSTVVTFDAGATRPNANAVFNVSRPTACLHCGVPKKRSRHVSC
jgi:hypothetical protein